MFDYLIQIKLRWHRHETSAKHCEISLQQDLCFLVSEWGRRPLLIWYTHAYYRSMNAVAILLWHRTYWIAVPCALQLKVIKTIMLSINWINNIYNTYPWGSCCQAVICLGIGGCSLLFPLAVKFMGNILGLWDFTPYWHIFCFPHLGMVELSSGLLFLKTPIRYRIILVFINTPV